MLGVGFLVCVVEDEREGGRSGGRVLWPDIYPSFLLGLKHSKTGVLTKFRKRLNKSNNDFEGVSSHQLKNFLNNRR